MYFRRNIPCIPKEHKIDFHESFSSTESKVIYRQIYKTEASVPIYWGCRRRCGLKPRSRRLCRSPHRPPGRSRLHHSQRFPRDQLAASFLHRWGGVRVVSFACRARRNDLDEVCGCVAFWAGVISWAVIAVWKVVAASVDQDSNSEIRCNTTMCCQLSGTLRLSSI